MHNWLRKVVGCELNDGTKDGTKLVHGFNEGTKLTLEELEGNPTQILGPRRDQNRNRLAILLL